MKYLFFAIIFCMGIRGGYAQLNVDPSLISFLEERYPELVKGGDLDTSTALLGTMKYLDISGLSLESLNGIEYFTGLVELNAAHNALTLLPELPAGLEYLDLTGNLLENIAVELPASLIRLKVGYNRLTSLPELPLSLRELNCEGNNFSGEVEIPAHVEVYKK